ncbi:MAG: hypothetical protein KDD45_17020, partial [Bdellovibrionales bacterium]|nr:hypothetical protein [Bdellovibrionales bacterium]
KNDFKIIESYEQSLIFFNNKAKVFIFGFEKDLIAPPEDLLQWTEYFANYEGPIILPGDHFQFLESLPKILNSLLHACPNFS